MDNNKDLIEALEKHTEALNRHTEALNKCINIYYTGALERFETSASRICESAAIFGNDVEKLSQVASIFGDAADKMLYSMNR